MLFSYRNGDPITEDEMLIRTDDKKELLFEVKIDGVAIELFRLPRICLNDEESIFYLQQGMFLYLIYEKVPADCKCKYISYIIEQCVEHGKMKIKNIDSCIIVGNDEPLLRYCVPAKADEKKNVVIGVKEILDRIKFMQEKEKEYLVGKIEEFFEPKQEEVVMSRGRGRPPKRSVPIFNEPLKINKINKTGPISKLIETPFEYDGKTFYSVASFLREYDINGSTWDKALRKGMDLKEIVERYSRKIGKSSTRIKSGTKMPIEYDGKTFESMATFCTEYKMNPSTVSESFKKGLTAEEIVKRYANRVGKGMRGAWDRTSKSVECNGVVYPSVNRFIEENNLSRTIAAQAFRMGMAPEEIVKRYPRKDTTNKVGRKADTFEYAGQKLTKKELSEVSGVPLRTIESRLGHGWSVERAVETPVIE